MFDINKVYAAIVFDYFRYLRELLATKNLENMSSFKFSDYMASIKTMEPYHPEREKKGDNRYMFLVDAFGYRLPVWRVVDSVLMESFPEEVNRVKQYEHMVFLFNESVRYVKVREHAKASDQKFAELGLFPETYNAIHSSELLLKQAGKYEFDILRAVIERLCDELASLVKHGNLLATEEELEDFRVKCADICVGFA